MLYNNIISNCTSSAAMARRPSKVNREWVGNYYYFKNLIPLIRNMAHTSSVVHIMYMHTYTLRTEEYNLVGFLQVLKI